MLRKIGFCTAHFYLLLLFSQPAVSQTLIHGRVMEASGDALPGINMMIQGKGSTVIAAYMLTDDKGDYRLEYEGTADSIIISLSGFNVAKQSETIANKSRQLNFTTETKALELTEVKIKAPKIKQTGDTLNYIVSGYIDANDRVIGDVLKKMPGIVIAESGEIAYNGKPINKFYIENMDLLQGRYGIATGSISAKDVASVQILENHQPIKALMEKEFSDKAAINIRLKESAKGTLTTTAQLGGGARPLLWNNELSTMYFARKRQHINTYKGNNTGNNNSWEMNPFYSGEQMAENSFLAVQSPATPDISQKRYLFNREHLLTTNNIWNLGKDYLLNVHLSYLNDCRQKDSYARSEYYLPGNAPLLIEERLSSGTDINRFNADIQLSTNKKEFYFTNLLRLNIHHAKESGTVFQTDTIQQNLRKPDFVLGNTLDLVRNRNKTTLRLYSFNGYSASPHTLYVQPAPYAIFGDKDLQQEVSNNTFLSKNTISSGWEKGAWQQNYEAGFVTSLQDMNTTLQMKDQPTADSLMNNLQWNQYQFSIAPKYTYKKLRFEVVLNLPLRYNILHINDRITQQKWHMDHFFFNPSLILHVKLSALWKISVHTGYNNRLGDISNGYTGYIMQTYRSLTRNDGLLSKQKLQNYGMNLSYRKPIYALFGYLDVTYTHTHSNLLNRFNYQDIVSVQTSVDEPNTSGGFSIRANISKGIDAIASTIKLNAGYNHSSAMQISQDELVPFNYRTYHIAPVITTTLKHWASLSYSLNYSQSNNKTKNGQYSFPRIRIMLQHASLNLFPLKNMTLSIRYDRFSNNVISEHHISFADISAKYTLKNTEWVLEYNNIFNTNQYVSASYTDLNMFYSAYKLRPANILLKLRFKL